MNVLLTARCRHAPGQPGRRVGRKQRAQTPLARGFGLLEALVALVIFSLAGLALFSWINNNLANAARLNDRQAEVLARAEALAWLQTIDPLRQPRGDIELSTGARLRWTASALTPLTSGAPFPGGISSPFRLSLYEVQARLESKGQGTPLLLSIRKTGVERDPVQAAQP